MAWRIETSTGESAEWTADGELVMSDPESWEAWSAEMRDQGGAEVAVPGVIVMPPPKSEVEAYALAVVYFDSTMPVDTEATVTGKPPAVSSLWLAPGEVEDPDRVY